MVRSFSGEAIEDETIDRLVEYALSGPSAGNARSLHLLVLDGAAVDRYWTVTLPGTARESFAWPGLLRAPVLVVPYVSATAYLDRYSEPDKAATGLGESADRWPVPYWWVDGGAAVQSVLLGATALGLGACFFGQFGHEPAVRGEFAVPDVMRAVGTIAVGHADAAADRLSRSARRGRAAPAQHVHRGRW